MKSFKEYAITEASKEKPIRALNSMSKRYSFAKGKDGINVYIGSQLLGSFDDFDTMLETGVSDD